MVLDSVVSPLLLYAVLVLMLAYFVKSWLSPASNIPPYPARPWPILGHLPYLRAKDPRKVMMEWKHKCGDLFSLKMGPRLVVVLNSFEVMKESLVKQADIFSDRGPLFGAHFTENGYKGILNASGPEWKEQRSVSIAILRNFGMGKNVLAENIQAEIQSYLEELNKLKGKPTDIRGPTNASVSNVICAIIVGKRFDYHDPYFTNFLDIFHEQVRLVAGTGLVNWFPWLRHVPGDLFSMKKYLQNDKAVTNYFSKYIKESEKGYDEANLDSFIDAYFKEKNQKERKGKETTMDGVSLRLVIKQLLLDGSETMSMAILWFVLFMIHNQDVQKKIYKEIVDVVGTERMPSMQDRSKLNYVNAAIMETQRRASIVPFAFPHWVRTETQVRGYTIPKDTFIWPNLDAVLWNEKTWGDPMNFRPERFLDAKGNLVIREEMVPFSLGRRACMGEALAKMELFLYISALIQNFQILPEDSSNLPSLKGIFGTAVATLPYKVKLVVRQAS